MYLNLIPGTIGASICFLFAYLVWYKKKVWLITGATEQVKDKDKLAKCMGIFLIATGIYLFLLFAFIKIIPTNITLISAFSFCLITLVFRIVLLIRIK